MMEGFPKTQVEMRSAMNQRSLRLSTNDVEGLVIPFVPHQHRGVQFQLSEDIG